MLHRAIVRVGCPDIEQGNNMRHGRVVWIFAVPNGIRGVMGRFDLALTSKEFERRLPGCCIRAIICNIILEDENLQLRVLSPGLVNSRRVQTSANFLTRRLHIADRCKVWRLGSCIGQIFSPTTSMSIKGCHCTQLCFSKSRTATASLSALCEI